MVRVALVSIAVALGGCASVPEQPDYLMPEDQWEFVCEQTKALGYDKVDCSKTPRPTIVLSLVVADMEAPGETLYGFTYDGEPYIFVNPERSEKEWAEVAVHEATHYLLSQTYGMRNMGLGIGACESEDIARQVGALWSGEPVDERWRVLYGCQTDSEVK